MVLGTFPRQTSHLWLSRHSDEKKAVTGRCFNGKVHGTVRIRRKPAIACYVMFAMGLASSLAGCNPAARHRILAFFFDGVPPLGSQQVQKEQSDMQLAQRRDGSGVSESEKQVWFVHEPRKDCTNCHVRGVQSISSSAGLIAPIPELCFRCHTDFLASELFVHGPVAVGECLFCHENHKSRIPGLLRKEEPELCYECHEILKSEPMPGHPSDPNQQCTQCHDPHTGSDRRFLKEQ